MRTAVHPATPAAAEPGQEEKKTEAGLSARELRRQLTIKQKKSQRVYKQEELARQRAAGHVLGSAVKELVWEGENSVIGQCCVVRTGGQFRTSWDLAMFVLLTFIGIFTP